MFLKKEIDDISQIHIGNQWIHVLPKMTKAKLRSISRKITICPSIRNYEEMKAYWKSIYGYELIDQNDPIYFNVTFGKVDGAFGGDTFCYPMQVRPKLFFSKDRELSLKPN